MSSAIKQLYDNNTIPVASWTIIIYLNGESDLLDDVKRNYNQVAKFGSELGKVNFVVLFDGLKVPEEGEETGGGNLPPALYYVSRYEQFSEAVPLDEFPKQEDLTKTGNLAFILKKIKGKFKSAKYGFIYNGHAGAGGPAVGNEKMMVKLASQKAGESDEAFTKRLKQTCEKDGWQLQGTCQHIDNERLILAVFAKEGNGDTLTYEKMSIALREAGFNRKNDSLGFVCLDCCWGQTFEASFCFRECTRYLIASPDEAALLGIGYDDFAEFMLKKYETARFDELANNLVGIYFKHNYDDYLNGEGFDHMGVSLSCVDMGSWKEKDPYGRKIGNAVLWKMDELAGYLAKNLERLWWVVSWARRKCVDYTYTNPNDYKTYNIDLMWFLENLLHYNRLSAKYGGKSDPDLHLYASRLVLELSMRFIKSNLASNYKTLEINSTEPQLGGKGLTITFPVTKEQLDNSIYGKSKAFTGNKAWKGFLARYAALAAKPPRITRNRPPSTTAEKYRNGRAAG